MKDLKEIRYFVKEVRYKEIVLSEKEGFDMPNTYSELEEIITEIKNDPSCYGTPDDIGEYFIEGKIFYVTENGVIE